MSIRISSVRNCLTEIAARVEDGIEYINHGGCATYAVELAKRLFSLGFNDVLLRVYNASDFAPADVAIVEDNIRQNNGWVDDSEEWCMEGVEFGHVRVQWRGRLWDATGSTPVSKGRKYGYDYVLADGSVSLDAMEQLAATPHNWNERFDRAQIPVMTAIMDDCFGKYFP